MTFLVAKSYSFFTYINFSNVHAGLNGQQSGLEDDFLALWQSAEVSKARRHTAARLVEDGVDGAYERIVAVV